MEIIWSKEAKQVVVEMNPWTIIGNLMAAFEAHVRLRRPWKEPPGVLQEVGWLNPVLAQPLAIAPIIERLRQQNILLESGLPEEALAKGVTMDKALKEIAARKLEPLATLSDFAATLWDYMSRIEMAKLWSNSVYDPSTLIYGPFLPHAVGVYQVGSPDGLSLVDPHSSGAANFAEYLWQVDSPLHDIKMLEPDAKDIPVPQSGTLGQIVVTAARNQRAADMIRVYRLQATLVDLPMVWDWIVRIGELGKKHGLGIADEIDAMAPFVAELLSYRHPLVYYAGEAFRNMTADTPDGPAKAFAASPGMIKKLTEGPEAGWSSLLPLLRSVVTAAPLAGAAYRSKERPDRVDVFGLITNLRPVLEQRAESMRTVASSLWKGKPSVSPVTLVFNKPAIGVTDGINASVTAHEVMIGIRQLTPITSIGLRFDIAREHWHWHEFIVTPIEREEAPGEYIAPSDGMPRDILPHALYMGEAGAIAQPSRSLWTRLSQFGMTGHVRRLTSDYGIWPDRPGTYGLDTTAAMEAAATTVREPEGTYVKGSQAQIEASVKLPVGETLEVAVQNSRFFVRPEGFATRTVLQSTHPKEYLYMFNESINVRPMERMWYADWPVNPQDLTLSRPLTTAMTAIIHGCFPGLAVEG